MLSPTVQAYLKAILLLETKAIPGPIRTGRIAQALAVSPSTVSGMIRTLSDANLVHYKRYDGVTLTEAGRQMATQALRRHRLLEVFLTQTLDMPWDQVNLEAERLEHAVSDRLVDRIDSLLGHPRFDPHGDPIPQADGSITRREERTLMDCQPPEELEIICVKHQEPAFLRFLSETGLDLNARATVLENRPEGGVMQLQVGRRHVTIARESAEKILVASVAGV